MKVHFTGIGGTGMGAMAGLMIEAGHEVRGSDGPVYPPMSDLLRALAIPLHEGYAASNLDWGPDLLVLGNTCKSDHPELLAAGRRGLRVVSFPQLLGETVLRQRHSIVVAGTHGKTTTTSLMAHVLAANGRAPGYLIGGVPLNFGRSFALGLAPYFVVEGDEYYSACFDRRPKFVHYQAQTAILTGIEFDHGDIFPDLAAVAAAFSLLTRAMPPQGLLLVGADSEVALTQAQSASCPFESYAVRAVDGEPFDSTIIWQGRYESSGPGLQRLHVRASGGAEAIGAFDVALSGAHNMANVLAVIAVAHRLQLETDGIAAALRTFHGVKRRQEVIGREAGITVIDDFAHHPTAVRETLRGLRGVHGSGRIVAVFEPRSGTSRRNTFQKQFVGALAQADRVYLAPLFAPEKIPEGERLDVGQLAQDLRGQQIPSLAASGVDEIVDQLRRDCRPGDTVVIMSSGGFDGIHSRLLQALAAR
jgi:UDP-N-acetylmuramate: L-alanyl-gamma-D-glutamyl-meso-diaminopimelate ligase